jgi:hypothetical protein
MTARSGLSPRLRVAAALAFVLAVGGGAWALAGSSAGDTDPAGDPYPKLTAPACTPAAVPAGQAHPAGEPEPMRPIWCYRLAVMPVTRVSEPNGWLDEFNAGISMGRLTDGDMDYRLFDVEHEGTRRAGVFVNNNHWMVDTAAGTHGGVLLRPNRAFRFEKGRMIVEADVAAGVPEYSDSASAEIVVTTAPAPTGKVVDPQYGYGTFGGHWTFGCRFQPDRQVTCALFNPSGSPGDPRVFGNELGRVWQMLPFQHVGRVVDVRPVGAESAPSFRRCGVNQMDLHCRDRFRLELARDSVRILVNGRPYFEQSAIDPAYQLPDEFLNAEQYVYFSSWVNRPLESTYRFHWDRLAINPRDASGHELPASAAPSFGMDSCGPRAHHGGGTACR